VVFSAYTDRQKPNAYRSCDPNARKNYMEEFDWRPLICAA
jgi:hypothetical protein